MPTWIDFKELRARLDFEQLLRYYGVEVKRKGSQHHGYCPLPNHKGKRNSPSFSANLERGIFNCFGCGATGNILEFAVLMEKENPKDGAVLRKVAMKLKERFCPDLGDAPREKKRPVPKTSLPPMKNLPVVINPPLDFELKGLDYEHSYLKERGFTRETIAHFGLGYCSRGLFKERIAIPLHDHEGKLVGYCGRVINDATINEDNPRYRFPSKREQREHVVEFRKQAFLYNGFRIMVPVDELAVVEGFTAVWWLRQNKFPNVVAVMGADCSEIQAQLIVSLVKPSGRIWLMPDGNKAGQRCALSLLTQVSPYRFTRWVKLDDDVQPTDLSANQLKACLQQ